MKQSTFSIIGERYLDTQHDDAYIEKLEQELERRKIKGFKRFLYEYIAASGLWWNIFWWEWCDLNEKDIKYGWIQNFAFFGTISAILTFMFNFWGGLGAFIVLHLLTTKIGFSLKNGSKLNQ